MDETQITSPHDPRTVIAQTLTKHTNPDMGIASISVAIAEDLAYWLTMKAGSFEPFDERTPGYSELAQRLLRR